MYEGFFTPEQQADIRARLPTGAGAEAILSAMHTLGELAATEATSPQIGPAGSYREQRDAWVYFKEMTGAYTQALLKIMPPRRTPEPDWWTLVRRGLGHLHAEAADAVASLDFLVKQNSRRRNSHREEIYERVLDIWTRLGGSLYPSHNQRHRKTTGPVIPYLRLTISLIFDEHMLSDNTLEGIVKRIRRRCYGKAPPANHHL